MPLLHTLLTPGSRAIRSWSAVSYRVSLIQSDLLKQAICCKHTWGRLHNNPRSRTVCQVAHALLLATWNYHQPQVGTYAHRDLQKAARQLCQGLANGTESFDNHRYLWLISPFALCFRPDYQTWARSHPLLPICCDNTHSFHPAAPHERFMVLITRIIVNSHSLPSISFFCRNKDESPDLLYHSTNQKTNYYCAILTKTGAKFLWVMSQMQPCALGAWPSHLEKNQFRDSMAIQCGAHLCGELFKGSFSSQNSKGKINFRPAVHSTAFTTAESQLRSTRRLHSHLVRAWCTCTSSQLVCKDIPLIPLSHNTGNPLFSSNIQAFLSCKGKVLPLTAP